MTAPFRSAGYGHYVSADAYAQRTLLGDDAYEPSTSYLYRQRRRQHAPLVGTPSSVEYASPLSEASHLHDDARLLFTTPFPLPSATTFNTTSSSSNNDTTHRHSSLVHEEEGETSGSDAEDSDEEDDEEVHVNPFLDQLDRVIPKSPIHPVTSPSTSSSSPAAAFGTRSPIRTYASSSSYAIQKRTTDSHHYYSYSRTAPAMPSRMNNNNHRTGFGYPNKSTTAATSSSPTFSYPLPYTPIVATPYTSPSSSPRKRATRSLASASTSAVDAPLVVKSTRPSPFPLGPKPPPRRTIVPRRKSLVGPQPHIVDLAVEKFNLDLPTLSTTNANAAAAVSTSTSTASTATSTSTTSAVSSSSPVSPTTTTTTTQKTRKQPMTALEIERERQWQLWDAERVQRQSLDLSSSSPIIVPASSSASAPATTTGADCVLATALPVIVRCSSKERVKREVKKELKKREQERKKEEQKKSGKRSSSSSWWSSLFSSCVGNRGHEEEDQVEVEKEREHERQDREEDEEDEDIVFVEEEEKTQLGSGSGGKVHKRRMLRRRA